MARDSKLWEEAYKKYESGTVKFRKPKSQRIKIKSLDIKKKKRLVRRTNNPLFLYALELEGGKYYVGQSTNPERRFKLHLKGRAAMWTKRHKPIRILETRPTGFYDQGKAALEEDKMTLEYAKKFGEGHVRGGGYCQNKPRWPSGEVKTVRTFAPKGEVETIHWLRSWI